MWCLFLGVQRVSLRDACFMNFAVLWSSASRRLIAILDKEIRSGNWILTPKTLTILSKMSLVSLKASLREDEPLSRIQEI